MTKASRARRISFLAATLVLLVGLFLAIVVMEPRTCGMDEFDCFAARNIYRYLTGFVSALLAIVIVVTGFATHDD
jgi:type IV secretory pathway VirB2 component (pilin)